MIDKDKPSISQEHWEELMEWYDGALMADGFGEALIGFGTQFKKGWYDSRGSTGVYGLQCIWSLYGGRNPSIYRRLYS